MTASTTAILLLRFTKATTTSSACCTSTTTTTTYYNHFCDVSCYNTPAAIAAIGTTATITATTSSTMILPVLHVRIIHGVVCCFTPCLALCTTACAASYFFIEFWLVVFEIEFSEHVYCKAREQAFVATDTVPHADLLVKLGYSAFCNNTPWTSQLAAMWRWHQPVPGYSATGTTSALGVLRSVNVKPHM